ncbi:MAG: GNAT family N-acetyltransferase [Candidatus Lokiarchaeota archaeon]|nr:GNAT family N-acetyltransferase [Candidatus Lokiarchaeota archaeon]MBD3201029.1 GNAT family N-acetyltransferase [Candidatus Lokiarchaeota archaeon]
MQNSKTSSKYVIKEGNEEAFINLKLCANDYIDLIDGFKEKFKNGKYFILTAYYKEVLIGLLIAEDKSKKVDSIEKIVPTINLNLIFVNKNYRNNNIGTKLLNTFIMLQKKRGFASIYITIPEKYKQGLHFFLNNKFLNRQFRQVGKLNNKIILEMNLWNDLGIFDCQIIKLDTFGFY